MTKEKDIYWFIGRRFKVVVRNYIIDENKVIEDFEKP